MKTDRAVEKAMAEDIQRKYGALVSVADLVRYYNLSWGVIANIIARYGCKSFGNGRGKKYYYEEVAEAFCRQ